MKLTGDIEIERWEDHIDEVLELVEGLDAWLFRIAGRGGREEIRRHLGHAPVSLGRDRVRTGLLVFLLFSRWVSAQSLSLSLLFCLFSHLRRLFLLLLILKRSALISGL